MAEALDNHASRPGRALVHASLDLNRAISDAVTVTTNLDTEIIVTTRDKISNTLHEILPKFRRSRAWPTPAGLAASLGIALLSTDFTKNILGVSAATWSALFWLATVASVLWLAWAIIGAIFRSASHKDVVDAIASTHRPDTNAPIPGFVTTTDDGD